MSLAVRVNAWYRAHARELPWREEPAPTPWEALVLEVMLQQTPVARVLGPWREWVTRWPTPAAMAAADPGDVIRAWGRLGYPRRALRLREAAQAIVDRHGGVVPSTVEALAALPGIGPYTSAAVAAFTFGRRVVVLDTNVRRVLARALGGEALPPPSPRAAEWARAEAALPADVAESVTWNMAAMELGALVCTARSPACGDCPIAGDCAWRRAGYPPDPHSAARKPQAWTGSDRQARGALMAALRDSPSGLAETALLARWPDEAQARRALESLIADGLARRTAAHVTLP
ncbi:MAG: A/G-specific adenine glycosylase [Propionibacteriaceae bacterium]|jgi:A/G-specific adenine glycosylase|nr:A/G-specific adenine glycosylase [Propionibacteriaceae bacterium]